MKVKDTLENYYYFSGKTSDLVRQLGFGGIALIWVFRYEANGTQTLPPELVWVGALVVLGLVLDLFHYISGTVVWGIYHRVKEKADPSETSNFRAPRAINWPALFCFWLKTLAIGTAYIKLLKFLWSRLVV
ncbi:MAG: hypothetical protein H8K10_12435 [Nitrospira sp.]|nr:hypothetical protein [Nitrospira sp.]